MYVLVRHAHAGDKQSWEGDDARRPLSGRGRQQAEGLVVSLRGTRVDRLVSSPYLRCVQSLEPLAARRSLPVEVSDLLEPHADPGPLAAWLVDRRLDGAVVCTHGETLTALFDRWADDGALVKLGHGATRASTQKGAAWVVTTDEKHTEARYLRPLHIGPPALAVG